MKYVRDLVILVAAIVGGLVVGAVGFWVLRTMMGNDEISVRIAGGIGVLVGFGILVYGSLWEEIVRIPQAKWRSQPRHTRGEGKLQTAELRLALVFGVVGYFMFAEARLSDLEAAIAVTCCALVGAVLGHDIKRRVHRIRQHLENQTPDVREDL